MESKKIPIDAFENNVELVKSNDTYDIHDLKLENLTVSMTVLHPGKQTRGHSHEDVEEVYYFSEGQGKMIVGEQEFEVKKGDLITIPLGKFHQVINNSENELKLLAIFEKYRKER